MIIGTGGKEAIKAVLRTGGQLAAEEEEHRVDCARGVQATRRGRRASYFQSEPFRRHCKQMGVSSGPSCFNLKDS